MRAGRGAADRAVSLGKVQRQPLCFVPVPKGEIWEFLWHSCSTAHRSLCRVSRSLGLVGWWPSFTPGGTELRHVEEMAARWIKLMLSNLFLPWER